MDGVRFKGHLSAAPEMLELSNSDDYQSPLSGRHTHAHIGLERGLRGALSSSAMVPTKEALDEHNMHNCDPNTVGGIGTGRAKAKVP